MLVCQSGAIMLVMVLNKWLVESERFLLNGDVTTARLDCLVLLEDHLGKDRAHLLAHPEIELTSEQEKVLSEQIERRSKHEPLAYIRGKTEFYGRDFIVNAHTLEPRPETETMIDLLKKIELDKPTICDIGTGSGAIAITAALELPHANVYACDISDECLHTAAQNNRSHRSNVTIYKSNLLESAGSSYDVLICNLPYVPDSHTINKAAMFEPRLAIFGGTDGLDLYRELFVQISEVETKPQYILTESLPFQHEVLADIAKQYNYSLQKTEDFIQLFVNAS
jgi:release factor glutamine methyltransferase